MTVLDDVEQNRSLPGVELNKEQVVEYQELASYSRPRMFLCTGAGDDDAGVWTVPSSSGRKSASSPCSRTSRSA